MRKKIYGLLSGILTAAMLAGTVGTFPVKAAVDFGWEEVDGNWYWYENGVKQGTEGRGKEIYDPDSYAWYWLDSVDGGKKATGKDLYQESAAGEWAENADGTGKWVRYDDEGHMVKGWHTNENGTYYFDLIYGTMAKGDVIIDGQHYTFDTVTGILQGEAPVQNGWYIVGDNWYWYENGVKQGTEGRGKEIYDPDSDAWYWLDAVDGGRKATGKDLYQESAAGEWAENADGTGKWVRYDDEGHMVKGWYTNEKGTYYFDLIYGTMAKGIVTIDGKQYEFNTTTGILIREVNQDSDNTENGGNTSDNATVERNIEWSISDDGLLTVTGKCGSDGLLWENQNEYECKAPWYEYRDSITSAYVSVEGVKNLRRLFDGCENLKNVDLSNLDTGNVTNMAFMFHDCSSLTNLDVSNFDTSKVWNMNGMFWDCSSLTSLDVSSFNTSKVQIINMMFMGCSSLESLDVSGFNTSKVTEMNAMFYGCSSLTSLDVSNFDTSEVDDMAFMFYDCSNLTSLDVSNFDTSNVTNMRGMFSNCSSLSSIDASNFDTFKVEDMRRMFFNCQNLNEIKVGSGWTTENVDTSEMFYNCGTSSVTYVN